MKPVFRALAVSAGLALALGVTAPARAAAAPLNCGTRDGQAPAKDFAEFSAVMADLAKDKQDGWPHAAKDEDRFPKTYRKLYLVLLDDKTECSEADSGRCKWGLTKPVAYRPSNGTDAIAVPQGFTTDLASIPRFAWSLLPPDGPWLKAAVIHDFLYKTCGKGVWLGYPRGFTRDGIYSRAEADWILRDAMKDRGVDVVRRNIIWAAVRVFGGGAWGH